MVGTIIPSLNNPTKRRKSMRKITFCLFFVISFILLTGSLAHAQFGSIIKGAAERGAEREVDRKVEELSRNAVKCIFNDVDCIGKAKNEGQEVVLTDDKGQILTDSQGQPISDPSQVPGQAAPQAPQAPQVPKAVPTSGSNYDFEPGERVLFEEDFSADNEGDFPRRLEFIQGNMQVVRWQNQGFLRADAKESRFAVRLPETLPDQFTIEFDLYDAPGSSGVSVALVEPPNFGWAWAHDHPEHFFVAGHRQGSGIWAKRGRHVSVLKDPRPSEEVVPIRIMVDGAHAKMFIGENRVANVPTASFGRSDKVYFFLEPQAPDKLTYVTNIRIAAGGKDLYDALMTDGRVAINNIYFDTGSANIRPESTSVLTEIGTMIQQHGDLSLLIEGHTDNEGDFDMNMKLSGDRAAAVKAYLIANFGIPADRLRTMGLGPSRAVAPNDSPEGRQQNRRVELVRM
jgi:outer membrane protein OmpA-like peptidoglycan-associated protein